MINYLCIRNTDSKLLVIGETYREENKFKSFQSIYITVKVTDNLSMPVKVDNFVEDPEGD
jgi:hypothetical protein